MPYIGNTSPSRFVSNRAASVYSGDGSTTAFTLEQAVVQDEDILVSVDGVIQEPSVAYAVSNATTLTFTGAPSSNAGNNIFVYYLASQVGTVGHPSSQALSATNGTFSGTLGVTGVPTFTGRSVHSGGITVANAGQIGSVGDTDAMAISSGGVVTFSQNTVGAGGMDLLLDSTVTTSGGEVNISSTYINSTYDDYYLVFNIDPATDNTNLNIKVFVDGSILTGDVYASEVAILSASAYYNDNDTSSFRLNSHGIGNAVGEGISGQVLFQNVNDTSHPFCYSGFNNFFNTGGNHNADAFAGSLIPANRASVVNGIRINMSGGELVGDFKLYGIRT